MFNNSKLKNKFNRLFLMLSLMPIFLLGIIIYIVINSVLKEEAIDKLSLLKETKKKELKNYFIEFENDIEYMLQDEKIKNYINEIINMTLDKITPDNIIDQNKIDFYRSKYNFEEIHIFSLNNSLLYSTNKDLNSKKNLLNYSNKKVIEKTYNSAKKGIFSISDIVINNSNKSKILITGIPFFIDNNLRAVIIGELNFKELENIIKFSIDDENSLIISKKNNRKIYVTNNPFGKIGEEISEDLISFSGDNLYKISDNKKYFVGVSNFEHLNLNWDIVIYIPVEKIYSWFYSLKKFYLLSALALMLITLVIIKIVTKQIAHPLEQLSEWAREIAEGELNLNQIITDNDEIGLLKENMSRIVNSLKKIALFTQAIAIGDLSKTIKLRSDKDILGKSINQMKENIKSFVSQTNFLAEENYSINIKPSSDKDEMAFSLIKLVNQLKLKTEDGEKNKWLIIGRNELNEKIKGEKEVYELSMIIINYIINRIEAESGTFYIKSDDRFKLAATYAFTKRKKIEQVIDFGEGLLGQTAIEKKIIIISDVPDEYMNIKSSLGETKPLNICIVPCLYNDEVECIFEIASLQNLNDIKIQFLKDVSESIAIAIHSAHVNKEMKDVLDKAIFQAKELQIQQEESKIINEELEEKNKSLKKQKEEISIKNQQLEETKRKIEEKAKELETASRYKSEFLANMSHELRTPLNSILILSQLLYEKTKGKLKEEEREYSKVIYSSGTDLLNLINDILDLSKIEAGKMELNIEEVAIIEIKDYVKNNFTHIAKEKELKLETNISNKLINGKLRTDKNKLLQIIRNLMSNALKFTKNGVITFGIDTLEDNSDILEVYVKDSGIGIADNKKRLIFEAFQQVDGTISRQYGGTGLGLSISKELSKLLNGEINVESEEGKGSKFMVYFPISIYKEQKNIIKEKEMKNKNIEEVEIKKEKKLENKKEITKENLKNEQKSILIIDDDIQFLHILTDIAKSKKFDVYTELNGEKGLITAQSKQPDAIILDLGLPGIDGWEVLERLKSNEKTRDIPVHIISASDKTEKADNSKIVDYVEKPVTVEEVNNVFSKIKKLKTIKKILIAETNQNEKELLEKTIKENNLDVEIIHVSSKKEVIRLIKENNLDCIILNLNIDNSKEIDLLEEIEKENKLNIPLIVHTNKKLQQNEYEKIKKYPGTILIKGSKYREEILNEVKTFIQNIDKKFEEIIEINDKKILDKKKILLVDDDVRNLFALTSVLENENMIVSIARNGIESLSKYKENKFDLILMDIMMPEMDGYTAIKKIREIDNKNNIPIIALTAKAMKEDKEKCLEAGANDYLSKPVDVEKMIELLKKWV